MADKKDSAVKAWLWKTRSAAPFTIYTLSANVGSPCICGSCCRDLKDPKWSSRHRACDTFLPWFRRAGLCSEGTAVDGTQLR